MNLLSRSIALSLFMSMTVVLCPNVSAQKEAEVNITIKEPPSGEPPKCKDDNFIGKLNSQFPASEMVELYYVRRAGTMVEILGEIVKANPCLRGIVINSETNNTITLYGKQVQRDYVKRVIAMLDLRREGVDMAMWGILISSDNPGELSQSMREINREVAQTRDLLLATYLKLEEEARKIEIDPALNNIFDQLGYRDALNPDRPYLSMTDILLRISAAADRETAYVTIAENLCKFFREDEEYAVKFSDYVRELGKRPFDNYLGKVMPGLQDDVGKCEQYSVSLYKEKGDDLARKFRRRRAILDFALNYAHFREEPNKFNSEELQKSAENLNSFLSPFIDAVNRDVEELFMEPTLRKIQGIVGHFGDVSYAEVGRTKVRGLNGISSSVASTTVSAFDETGPLRLNELLREAGDLNQFSKDLFPPLVDEVVPASSIISLFAALSADRSVFRSLTSGVSLDITPSVLRNSSSAELKIDLTTGPQEVQEPTPDEASQKVWGDSPKVRGQR
ncbi:hypothetical protein, partial [Crocosphaera sp. Alani8]|uniref:hypothetical protein n=1 Tax=Crocosphaera sp. Alani8 TaxID=3038952 RepID=UPI00313B0C66